MFNRLKSFSPSTIVGAFLVTFQILILIMGLANDWWRNTIATESSELVKTVNSYIEKIKEVDQIQNQDVKLKAMQKTMYVAIYDSKLLNEYITGEKYWKEFKKVFEKEKVDYQIDKSIDEKLVELTNNINQFNEYTTQKNYPTLSRVSARMKMRSLLQMDSKALENAIFSYSKDIEFMLTTVKTSNLSPELKNEAFLKIQGLSYSINQLAGEAKGKVSAEEALRNSWGYFGKFLDNAKNNALKNSMKDSSSFNLLFFMFLTLLVFTSLMSTWAIIEDSKTKKNARRFWESRFTELLNKVFMKDEQSADTNLFSKTFTSAIDQIHDFVQRKMNYGQMFQDTIPFPTLLIDSNLQVRWFNESMVQEWNLEEFVRQRESLTWEHFSQLTNMSSTDPVIDVIKNQHAGIFKLQVKPLTVESRPVPYQMYVTPYQIGAERLCLLFFYPLLSLEETIEMQTQSIIGPIKRTLNVMLADEYSNSFHDETRSDYEIGGIEEIHNLFKSVADKYEKISSNLLNQLSEEEIKTQDQKQLIQQVEGNIEQIKRLQAEMKDSFQSLKNSLIASFEGIENIKENVLAFKNSVTEEEKTGLQIYEHAQKLEKIFNITKEQSSVISQLKLTTKEVREAIQSHRSNSLKVVKAMMIFMEKQNNNTNPLHNTWSGMISELSKVPDFFATLDRYVQHIDLTLGKVLLKTDDSFKSVQNVLPSKCESKISNNIVSLTEQFSTFDQAKDIMIDNMKEVYSSMINQSKVVINVQEQLYNSNQFVPRDDDFIESGNNHFPI